MLINILSEKCLATPDCFAIYLVNAESVESCPVCSETGFISFVVVAHTEE